MKSHDPKSPDAIQRDETAAPAPNAALPAPDEHERLYRLLASNAREVVSLHASDLTILYVSPAARWVLEYDPDELIGHRLDDLVHPDDLSELLSVFAVVRDAQRESSAVFRCRTPDREWRWCEVFCRAADDSSMGEIQATIRDISKYKRIEKAIERVAREWRSTFDSANDAIVMLDAGARILRVNLATLKLLDCTFKDLIGQPLVDVVRERLGLDDPFGLECVWSEHEQVRSDSEVQSRSIWIRSTVDPILEADNRISGAVVFIADITNEKGAELRLRSTLDEVRELSSHLQTVREEERRSIAREVHDELGHALTALKMDIAWLVKRIPDSDETARRSGDELIQLIDQTITVVRRIVSELRPPVLDDLGLDAALEWLCSDFKRYSGLEAELEIDDVPPRLRGANTSAIFRIVQEALTNVSRHADASRVSIRFGRDGEGYVLLVGDDGRGFDCTRTREVAGFGLLGMSERVRDLGGDLEIDSQPGSGTRLSITLPEHVLT